MPLIPTSCCLNPGGRVVWDSRKSNTDGGAYLIGFIRVLKGVMYVFVFTLNLLPSDMQQRELLIGSMEVWIWI